MGIAARLVIALMIARRDLYIVDVLLQRIRYLSLVLLVPYRDLNKPGLTLGGVVRGMARFPRVATVAAGRPSTFVPVVVSCELLLLSGSASLDLVGSETLQIGDAGLKALHTLLLPIGRHLGPRVLSLEASSLGRRRVVHRIVQLRGSGVF